jgi:hypothetical protein
MFIEPMSIKQQKLRQERNIQFFAYLLESEEADIPLLTELLVAGGVIAIDMLPLTGQRAR